MNKDKINKKGQNAIEYMLIFSIVVVIVVAALGPGGFVEQQINESLFESADGIQQMANNICFADDAGPWTVSSWSPCSPSCGPGTQTRSVTCPSGCCNIKKPVAIQACNNGPCCVPSKTTCNAGECGDIDNGCGTPIVCGSCTLPETCGGGGIPNQCGCTPSNTCASVGAECGAIGDGCGNTIICPNTCAAPQTCGGGTPSNPNKCGCTGTNTCASLGAECGTIDDGCGNTITCPDTCTAPQTCGGGTPSDPNKCGCTPKKCTSTDCGTVSDGCGNTTDCGTCTCWEGEPISTVGGCSGPADSTCSFVTPCTLGDTCTNCTFVASLGVWRSQPFRCVVCGCLPQLTKVLCYKKQCGTVTDCGAPVDCGQCPSGTTCSNYQCVCVPTTSCAAVGGNCGSIWDGSKTVSCGSGCSSGYSCINNKCVLVSQTYSIGDYDAGGGYAYAQDSSVQTNANRLCVEKSGGQLTKATSWTRYSSDIHNTYCGWTGSFWGCDSSCSGCFGGISSVTCSP